MNYTEVVERFWKINQNEKEIQPQIFSALNW